MVDLLKFTTNIKKRLNGLVAQFTTEFVIQFCPKFSYIEPKKNLGLSQTFLSIKKNHKFLKFIYNYYYYFQTRVAL